MKRDHAAWARRITRLDTPVTGHYCYCLCPVHQDQTGPICEGSPLTHAIDFTLSPVLACTACADWWRDNRTVIDGEIVTERRQLPSR